MIIYSNTYSYLSPQFEPQQGSLNPQQYYENEENWGDYQFVGLEDIVNNFINTYLGDDTLLGHIGRDKVIYQAKSGIREFTFSILNQPKAIELELTDTYNIILPPDFVSYIRISWVDRVTGKIRPLSVNRHAPLATAYLQDNKASILFDNDGNILEGTTMLEAYNDALVNPPIEQSSPLLIFPNFGFATRYDIEQQWNLDTARNYNGTFSINNNRIHFSTDNKDRIILLEYISDGLAGEESEMKVHKFAEEALYSYINYNLCKNSIRIPNYEKINVKKEYDRLYRNARVKLLGIKPQEFIQAWKQGKAWLR